ncbi:MAG: MFS transporter [Actinomycetales bacterium]|nr:MFS transporter [Actinomycetales bacterium]
MPSAAPPEPAAAPGATRPRRDRTPHPWAMLAVGVFAQAGGSLVQTTPAFLLPLLTLQQGMPLAAASLLAVTPGLGLLVSLVAWGAAADRWGERIVLVAGQAVMALGLVAAIVAQGPWALGVALFVAGIGSASPSSASGRVVIGWFARERRGLAMGIRQMSFPLGAMAGALAVPPLVAGGDVHPALLFDLGWVLLAGVLCAAIVIDPPRPALVRDAAGRVANPYRGGAQLVRIHLVSALLVMPQYVLLTFGLVWLIADQGWNPTAAGVVVALAQGIGALGRVGVGVLSDRVGSRLRPLRWVAIAGIPLLLLTAAAGWAHQPVLVAVAYVLATCVSVADNGLAFTAVAEIAGSAWSGRALGVQNSGQYVASAIAVPLVGALVGLVGYAGAFAIIAAAPAVAVPLVPRDAGPADGDT